MRQNQLITLALAIGLAGTAVSAYAQDQTPARVASSDQPKQPANATSAAQESVPDPSRPRQATSKPSSANDSPPSTPTDASASPATPAGSEQTAPKPATKPHHVITNEDIEAQREQMASANSDIDIGNINDCDHTCFDWVRIIRRTIT